MDSSQLQNIKRLSPLEWVIIVSSAVLLMIVSLTAYKGATLDKNFSKADKDLQTLKSAVMSYWSHNKLVFPKDVGRSLASTNPSVVTEILLDPWATDPKTLGYGFMKAMHPNIGEYFVLYTQGPQKDTKPKLNASSQVIEYSGSGIVVSNLPTKKLN